MVCLSLLISIAIFVALVPRNAGLSRSIVFMWLGEMRCAAFLLYLIYSYVRFLPLCAVPKLLVSDVTTVKGGR